MFEDFSFDTARSPSMDSNNTSSTTRDTSRSVSPCSPTGPFPPPTFSVTDLAACFANSKMIRREAQICYDACDSYANLDDDADWHIPTAEEEGAPTSIRSRPHPRQQQRSHSRTQRQMGARLLCNSTHHKDIASLVSRMVESRDQCSITVSADPSSPTEDERSIMYDEGYDSSDTGPSRRSSLAVPRSRLDYRRSSDLKTTSGACVSKAVRFRNKQSKRIRSAENEG